MIAVPTRNLVIVHTPLSQALSDWLTVKEKIAAMAPDIDVRIVSNLLPDLLNPETRRWQIARPSLVFSPLHMVNFKPTAGTVYFGKNLDKLHEVRRLARAGVPVPRSVRLIEGLKLNPDEWGEYIVVKPTREGSFGKGVRLVTTMAIGSRFAELTDGGKRGMLVQRHIDARDEHGRMFHCRVLTMFARILYATQDTLLQPSQPLAAIAADPAGIIATNTPGQEQDWALTFDDRILELAVRAANVFAEIPCLGIDIIRDRSTGELFVLETNPGGNTWHLSSAYINHNQTADFRAKKYAQFDALQVAAETLIQKTRDEAS